MTLRVKIAETPNGDGDLHKSTDDAGAEGQQELLVAGDLAVLHMSTTTAGNVGSGEDILGSITSNPLALFNGDRAAVKFIAHGTWANNANAKTLRMKFGGTTVLTFEAPTNKPGTFIIEMTVLRISDSAQRCFAELRALDTTDPSGPVVAIFQGFADAAEDEGATIVTQLTGEGVDNNDLRSLGHLLVELGRQ